MSLPDDPSADPSADPGTEPTESSSPTENNNIAFAKLSVFVPDDDTLEVVTADLIKLWDAVYIREWQEFEPLLSSEEVLSAFFGFYTQRDDFDVKRLEILDLGKEEWLKRRSDIFVFCRNVTNSVLFMGTNGTCDEQHLLSWREDVLAQTRILKEHWNEHWPKEEQGRWMEMLRSCPDTGRAAVSSLE